MSAASRITRGTLDANVVVSNAAFTVKGILVSNGSAADVEIRFNDKSGTAVLTMAVKAGSSGITPSGSFQIDGLTVVSLGDATVVVTVFHDSLGS